MRTTELTKEDGYWKGAFMAMACPCDVLMEVSEESLARDILTVVADEAWRIEDKFSRYQQDNIIYRINHSEGDVADVDDETNRLFDFADELFDLSEGLFDITSGVLRQVWTFDGSDNLPSAEAVDSIVQNIGWNKVQREKGTVRLPAGMEVDLGGIGKEYAVDRCVLLVREMTDQSVLVNFGGDLAVTCGRRDNACWSVGRLITGSNEAVSTFQLYKGAIATSGDAHRFLVKAGVRYSHILNPKTGWPVMNAPHTVSVAAGTCIEAGMLSTFAMLHGAQAEEFLKLQEVDYWID